MPPAAPRDPPPTPDSVRGALHELLHRVEQVRGALAADRRALDDRTLLQMLDTRAAWAALGEPGPPGEPER